MSSDLRERALDHAVTIATLVRSDKVDPKEVVAAAREFLEFLSPREKLGNLLADAPPPLPTQDLSNSDQTPETRKDETAFRLPGGYRYVEPEELPTRLLSRTHGEG